MLNNKRGQGMSTDTLVLIILGVVVLAVLVIGFTIGWNKMLPFLSNNNVQGIVDSCGAACSINGLYDYCTAPRDLKTDNESIKGTTCNFLSDKKPNYGVAKCPSVKCPQVLVDVAAGETIDSKCVGSNAGKTIQSLVNNEFVTKDCPA